MQGLAHEERMNSKERVQRTFRFEETDRVPINYMSNPDIDRRLKEHFNLRPDQSFELKEALGVDIRAVNAPYTGERLHAEIPDRRVNPLWGWQTRYVEHDSGGYWDYCDFPLRDADIDTVAAWPMPSADDYDYEILSEQCDRLAQYGLHVGNPGLACIMNTAGFLRGMEQVFIDLATDDPAGLLLIDRMLDAQYENLKRMLESAADRIDFVWFGEDLGTQNGPIISRKTFTEHIRPRHERFLDLVNHYELPSMLHTCGSSSWTYEDYIEMGLSAVDTLQPEATDMSPQYLKDTYGGRLAFQGCISTAGPLAYGTVNEVVKNVEETLQIMMPGGGYFLSPTHAIQDNTPTENVVAMYETAHRVGRY